MNGETQIVIAPKPSGSASVLDGAPRDGFTQHAAKFFQVFVPVDEISIETLMAYQRRCDKLQTLIGCQQGKANGAIKRAVVGRG